MRIQGLPTVLPFHRAVVRHEDFTSEDKLGVHTTWIETEFAETASPEIARSAPGAERSTLTVELDGKAVQIGLPVRLYEALLNGGGGAAGPGEACFPAWLAGLLGTTPNSPPRCPGPS
jgi:acetyl-CoA/propionyl-CoA carboxylase biotin carboxyl carrier protein